MVSGNWQHKTHEYCHVLVRFNITSRPHDDVANRDTAAAVVANNNDVAAAFFVVAFNDKEIYICETINVGSIIFIY